MEPLIFIALIIGFSIVFLMGLFFIISPMSIYNIFRINYYCCYITENGNVVKRLIQRAKGQWVIIWNKKAYLIPFAYMVRYKNGNIFYSDIKNTFSIKILTKEQEDIRTEILKEQRVKSGAFIRARMILNKIPVVGMFMQMKGAEINEVVLANKFILNPDFIVDSAQFYIMLTQDITKKILTKPKNLSDIIVELMPYIIIAIIVIVIGIVYIQSKQGGVQT